MSSPFGKEVRAVRLDDHEQGWTRRFLERVPHPILPLTDGVVVQGDHGTLWALDNSDGEILWTMPPPDPVDYPMGPPRFREGAVFTISRRGMVRRVTRTGELTAYALRELDWGSRRAQTVPFRSNQAELSYLDQAARLTTYEPATLELLSLEMLGPEQRSDVLAGAFLASGETTWLVELPGRLRSVGGGTPWRREFGSREDLWSADGQLLAVPSPSDYGGVANVLLVSRGLAGVYRGGDGDLLTSLALPSEAMCPPVYDREIHTRWVLCRHHLVALGPDLVWDVFPLPLVDTPYSIEVSGTTVIVGALEGRVYRLVVPQNSPNR